MPKPDDPVELTRDVKQEARRLGFSLTGVCPAVRPEGLDEFYDWIAAGYAGQMHYLANRAEAYAHPDAVLDGARSLVMLGMQYSNQVATEPGAAAGRVARYAWGTIDYHDLIHRRLKQLKSYLADRAPTAKVRGVVDTAPLLEREFAQLAGLGWIGKNTLLLNRTAGSWFFLAALVTDLVLEYDQSHEADHCGSCRACLDACPTDAFPKPYVLDATRCISYLTIELKESMPVELREPIGDWVFGCDVCQDVCPWNRRPPDTLEAELQPVDQLNPLDLPALFAMDDDGFRRQFRKTPLWRSRRRGVLRNAAVALGNRRSSPGLAALCRGINDEEPMVRAACAWSLGRYSEPVAREMLVARRKIESDVHVISEIDLALGSGGAS